MHDLSALTDHSNEHAAKKRKISQPPRNQVKQSSSFADVLEKLQVNTTNADSGLWGCASVTLRNISASEGGAGLWERSAVPPIDEKRDSIGMCCILTCTPVNNAQYFNK